MNKNVIGKSPKYVKVSMEKIAQRMETKKNSKLNFKKKEVVEDTKSNEYEDIE